MPEIPTDEDGHTIDVGAVTVDDEPIRGEMVDEPIHGDVLNAPENPILDTPAQRDERPIDVMVNVAWAMQNAGHEGARTIFVSLPRPELTAAEAHALGTWLIKSADFIAEIRQLAGAEE